MTISEVVSLRPEQPADEPFLFEVYASTRAEELALTNWDQATRRAFLMMQFQAMRQGYRDRFPAAEFSIVEMSGQPVGRMVLNSSPETIRIVDLALLPDHRKRGIGTVLMRQVCAKAAGKGSTVRLSVLKSSQALRWYERLGFRKFSESDIHDEMEWRSPAQPV